MAKKLADQSLEELYDRPKISPAAAKHIKEKEDFSDIQPRYCEAVCGLKCKSYHQQHVDNEQADVVFLQDHKALASRFKSADQEEAILERILGRLRSLHFGNVSCKTVDVMKCRPTAKAVGTGKKVTESNMLKCSAYALQEIKAAKPKVIVCMSTTACKMLGFKASIFNERGEIKYYHGIPVVITLHPVYITMIRQQASGQMWGPDYYELLNRDMKKAAWLADGRLVIPDLDEAIELHRKRQIHICRTNDHVRELMEEMLTNVPGTVYSFDLETTSLDPWSEDARILTAQLGFRKKDGLIHAYVIPLWHRENNELDPDEAWADLLPFFSEQYCKTGHNLKFDVLFTAVTQGVRIKGITFDTMLHLHDINSGVQKNYGLKRAVWDFIPSTGLGGYEDKLPSLTKK